MLEAFDVALFGAPVSGAASSSATDPLSPGPPSSSNPRIRAMGASAATAEARSRKLLGLKLETISVMYSSKKQGRWEDLQQAYTVKWAAELGQGTFGKVYLGTKAPATGLNPVECQGDFAIKILRDGEPGVCDGGDSEAISAAENEVRRHVALGLHPNLVGLVDVGLFWQPTHQPRGQSWSAHIGLVFDLYEIDVRQFLKKSSFTQGK